MGVAAAPAILARLVPDLDQTNLTPAQAAAKLDGLGQLQTVQFVPPADVAAKTTLINADRVLTAAGMRPVGPVVHPVGPVVHPIAEQPVAVQPQIGHEVAAARVTSTISRTLFDQLVSGTFVQPVAPALKFQIPATVLTPLRQQISDVAQALIGTTISATDAAALPVTSLPNGFDALRATIVSALDPSKTILSMVNSQISSLTAPQAAALDDIMAAPDLSEPTYQALADISHDWMLPGVDTLPADTTTLVESNRAFINAFLVGMNHELARELLWREYPTDQRGTYSRQFWSHRDTGDPADQYDLTHLLHQAPTLDLQALSDRPGGRSLPLVLVVKGDLVRRYPGMIVTAANTKKSGAIRAMDPATEIQPDFIARLEPDVLLVGFNTLSADLVWSAAGE